MNTATNRSWHQSPYAATILAIAMCFIKGTLKIALGTAVRSPMIIGSGLHDFGDSVQEVMLLFGLMLKKREAKGYPYGYKEVETALTMVIGLILVVTGIKIGKESAIGLLAQWHFGDTWLRNHVSFLPNYEEVRIEPRLLFPLTGLMAFSIAFSLGTSWFQIRIGKLNNEPAIVADGKETRSDAVVEFVGLLGVIAVQFFHQRWAEYALGLGVTYFVFHTAHDVMGPTIDIFLKKSFGDEAEIALRNAALSVHGIEDVTKLVDFRVGSRLAVCNMTVVTRLGSARHANLRYATERAIERVLRTVEGIEECDINVAIAAPSNGVHRIAYACTFHEGRALIVGALSDASHLVICDVVRDDPSKGKIRMHEIKGDPTEFVRSKRVERLFVFRDHEHLRGTGNNIRFARSPNPETELGVSLFS